MALNYIKLPSCLLPSVVENCHFEFPLMSSKETVLKELNLDNAYKKSSPLPNVNPRLPQLLYVEPAVYLIQAAE